MARDRPPFEGAYDDAERTQEERRRLVKEAMNRFYAPDATTAEKATAGRPDRQEAAPRDLVATPKGARPQRSTEEHGSGLVRDMPARPAEHTRSEQVGPASAGPGTPEGHAPERPATTEYGKVGTPAAALTAAVPHAADAEAATADDHPAAHPDAHEEAALGPIDWRAWGAAGIGVGVAALVAILFYVATLPR